MELCISLNTVALGPCFYDVSFVTVDGSVVNVNIGRTKDAPTSS